MTLPKKIALFYGHVASNIGDLAINGGTINLLRSVFPGANIDVVLIDADASEFLDVAKSSFEDQGDIRFTSLKTHGEKATLYLRSPHLLLEEAGVTNADVILLSAGEHLFCYQHEENAKSLFWRTFPAYAAKFLGNKCIQLPSTLGPFETERSSALFSSLLDLTDALAVRDGRSLQMLKTRYAAERPLLLDPAFFLDAPIGAEAQQKHGATALVMRSEGWGIRLSNTSRKEQTERFKSTGYEASKAFAFSLDFATRLLNTTDEALRVFVQTTADQELAEELGKRLPEFIESGRLTIESPCSVQDYLRRLSDVDRVVANRFHALILGLVANRQVYGLSFDAHGHKIPGLFNQLDVTGRYHNLSRTEPMAAVTAVLDEIARETSGDQNSLQERVEKLRRDTVAWLDNALQKPTATADARQLLTASVALSDFADAQLRASVEGNAKKQIELTKKSAQAKEAQWAQQRQQLEDELSRATATHQAALEELQAASADAQAKEAQWAQQRQQLEDELVATAAENQRLSAVNQAQLEALQLELPNTLSNKLGQALIEGVNSPSAVIKLPLRLYKLWRDAKSQQPPKTLGGDSFSEVLAAFENGGFDAVEKLFANPPLSPSVIANGYTALARHLKHTDVDQAGEAARLAYMADPKPFRRKWLAFRLNEAGKVLEAGSLLDSLPVDIDFSPSETDRAAGIRSHAQRERELASFSMNGSQKRMAAACVFTPAMAASNNEHSIDTTLVSDDQIVARGRTEGAEVICHEIMQAFKDDPEACTYELIRVGKLIRNEGLHEIEYELIKAAFRVNPTVSVLCEFVATAERTKHVEEACQAILDVEVSQCESLTEAESKKLAQLRRSMSYRLALIKKVPQKRQLAFPPVARRLCYVLHNSLPYSSGGYATRAQGVANGLVEAGFEVIALTRPGFPLDIKKELASTDVPDFDEIEGIKYMRALQPLRRGRSMYEYVMQSADVLERQFRELRPEFVLAASNHVTGLPSLIAARRLGITFMYEVRGLWEVTRLSRDAPFLDSAEFAVMSLLEAAVCKAADHVFTLTEPMREELIIRGVESAKIDLLPNSCDPVRFVPQERDHDLANRLSIAQDIPVIGYIGTFVDYEGLEDLASACALLKQQGIEFRLLLVGNENASGQDRGPITEQIAHIANSNGFAEWLVMPGRVPHEEVESYYSLIDIAPFPRKPWPVCEMVSPMKPLEAFAMEKAVVVSSVRALQEMVKHEETGLVFEKGNVKSLADVLERLVADPALRRTLGKNARKWVLKERTWAASTEILASYVRGLSQAPSPIVVKTMPVWWQTVPSEFRDRCHFRDITEWNLSNVAKDLKSEYESRFGKDSVAKKIPFSNWQRADICSQLIASDSPTSVLDIGSGLGEFVNIFSSTNPTVPIASVDVKDYALWFDRTGRVERIYKSIFDLGSDEVRDVVTCFEVIEHLPPERLDEAIRTLRSLAKRKLFVSVPFMEPLPLSKGHHSRFEDRDLLKLFPDAKFTIFSKGGKSPNKVLAWIMCEIDCETE